MAADDERAPAIEAVILDADGVVIFPWRFAALLEQEHGITRQMTRGFFHGPFQACVLGRADVRDVLPPYLAEWGWRGSVDEFMAAWLAAEDAVDARVAGLVRRLRAAGLMCCLATTQERHRAAYMRTAMGFEELFDRLFFSCDIGSQKPDPTFFHHVQAALRLDASRLLFWDDAPANVEAARACGWHAELYTGLNAFERVLRAYLPGAGRL